jgi:hypothetical protein
MKLLTIISLFLASLTCSGQTPVKTLSQADEKLVDLMLFGAEHGLNSLKSSAGSLTTFTIVEENGQRKLTRVVTDTYEEALERGMFPKH